MKATRIRTVEMVRKIRNRQASLLARKSPEEIIAFYRDAGKTAMEDVRQRTKARRRKAS